MARKRLEIVSFFRNSAGLQVRRFMDQVKRLQDASSMSLVIHVNAIHGDSHDNTAEWLLVESANRNIALSLIEHSHGQREFGSTEEPDRLAALTNLGNAGLASVSPEADFVWYVESDLIWTPQVVHELIIRVVNNGKPCVVAPLVFAGPHFYDVFCYRKNGARFAPFHPYHSELAHDGTLTPVDSIGSQFVTTGEVARTCRMAPGTVLMGFCADAWAQGYPVFVDASLRVDHPA